MQDRASFAQELAVYFSTSDNTWIILSRRDTCDGMQTIGLSSLMVSAIEDIGTQYPAQSREYPSTLWITSDVFHEFVNRSPTMRSVEGCDGNLFGLA